MRVLVADDDLTYRTLLEKLLSSWGYEVSVSEDGANAWEQLTSHSRDDVQVCLLDWVMPQVTGLEICKRLRSQRYLDDHGYVYTILLTGLSDKDKILKGLESGAHDYLVKPFNPGELRCRLDIGAKLMEAEQRLRRKNVELSRYANEMEELARSRAEQLVHADRMATLGVMAAGIAHEINNPTSFISGNLQIFQEFQPLIEEALTDMARGEGKKARQASFVKEELAKMLSSMNSGVERIAKIVQGLRQYSHSGGSKEGRVNLNESIEVALELCQNSLKHHVLREVQLMENPPPVNGDQQQIEQVLVNLFINSADALQEVGGGVLMISSRLEDDSLRVRIEDSGPGFPEEKLREIWKPFFTSKEVGKGTGLGLSICQRIIREHGGKIEASNREEGGARFDIELPLAPSERGRKEECRE